MVEAILSRCHEQPRLTLDCERLICVYRRSHKREVLMDPLLLAVIGLPVLWAAAAVIIAGWTGHI